MRNPNFYRVRVSNTSFSPAGRAGIFQPAGAFAALARKIEFHRAGHLRDFAGSVALGANGYIAAGRSGAAARLTGLLPRDIQAYLRAANRLPEIDVQRVLKVCSALRRLRALLPATAKKLAENIAEAALRLLRRLPPKSCSAGAAPAAFVNSLKSNPPKPMPPGSAARLTRVRRNVVRVKPKLVVYLALFLIAQDVVRFLNFLEALLGGLIARVQIRVILSRKPPIRLTDIIRICALRHRKCFVIILFCRHVLLQRTAAAKQPPSVLLHCPTASISLSACSAQCRHPRLLQLLIGSLLLIVDVDEFCVDDVVFRFLLPVRAPHRPADRP